jgi:hypothetical protein
MTKRLLLSLFVCIALAVLALAQTNAGANKQIRGAEIARIKAYCQQLDNFAKRNPKLGRLFANLSSDISGQKSQWREFKSEEERAEADTSDGLYDNANAWSKDGALVLVYSNFQTDSGDWVHQVDYYYRKDGSLAKIHARLDTFYGNVIVIRNRFYDPKGRLLSSSQQFFDLQTKKKIRPGADGVSFKDEPIPVYRTVEALPFYAARGKPAAKTK